MGTKRLRLRELTEANEALERDLAQDIAAQEVVQRQSQQLEALNKKISTEQQRFEDERKSERDQQREQQRQRALDIEDLQQQIRDLELCLQMRKRCEASLDSADIQTGHVVVTESDAPRGR